MIQQVGKKVPQVCIGDSLAISAYCFLACHLLSVTKTLPRVRFKTQQSHRLCHSVLPRHSRHPPLSLYYEWSAKDDGHAYADGSCRSYFLLLFFSPCSWDKITMTSRQFCHRDIKNIPIILSSVRPFAFENGKQRCDDIYLIAGTLAKNRFWLVAGPVPHGSHERLCHTKWNRTEF